MTSRHAKALGALGGSVRSEAKRQAAIRRAKIYWASPAGVARKAKMRKTGDGK